MESSVKIALDKLSPEYQSLFWENYNRRKRNTTSMVLLAIFFPIQLFLLDKVGLGILFLITGGGLMVWWVIEIFATSGRVKAYNNDVATAVLRDLKLLHNL